MQVFMTGLRPYCPPKPMDSEDLPFMLYTSGATGYLLWTSLMVRTVFVPSVADMAMKRVNNPKDVVRALELLDQANIYVCSDVIWLNSVLETCTHTRRPAVLRKTSTTSPSRVSAPSS